MLSHLSPKIIRQLQALRFGVRYHKQQTVSQPASALVSLAIQILAVKGVGVGNRDEALCPPQTRATIEFVE